MRTRGRKNRTKRQYRKSFTKRRSKRIKRTKRTKKSSKSKDDLKKFKKLQKKLEKLLMNSASKKEIDKTSKQLADLQKKMIKVSKKRMKGGATPSEGESDLQKQLEEAKANNELILKMLSDVQRIVCPIHLLSQDMREETLQKARAYNMPDTIQRW